MSFDLKIHPSLKPQLSSFSVTLGEIPIENNVHQGTIRDANGFHITP